MVDWFWGWGGITIIPCCFEEFEDCICGCWTIDIVCGCGWMAIVIGLEVFCAFAGIPI